MQLKITTDYAVRTLIHLAKKEGQATACEISDCLAIPRNYVPKIMESLRKAKLIQSNAGIKGGYVLAKNPEDISVYDVLELMETTLKLNRCLEEDGYCSRNATNHCPMHRFLEDIQTQLETTMKSTSIADLLER